MPMTYTDQVARSPHPPTRRVHERPHHLMDGRSLLLPSRYLILLFKRNPRDDAQSERIRYEGYQMYWPDGEMLSLNFQRFCQLGSRLLGLGKRMNGKSEQRVELGFHPIVGLESLLPQVQAGVRSRRFYIARNDGAGRIHFHNGTPTDLTFSASQEDSRILEWLRLLEIGDGECLWFDLSALTVAEEDNSRT